MTHVEELKAASDFLADPSHWIKGNLLSPNEAQACALGACFKSGLGTYSANKILSPYLPGGERAWETEDLLAVAAFNDDPETTHQDVLNLFDKALADLRGLG